MKERKAISSTVSALVVLVIILAGVAAYAFVYPPSGAPTTVTSTVTGAAASAAASLKVALIVPIASTDNSWNYQAEAQLKALQKVYGFNLQITENKFDGTAAQPVAEGYGSSGVNIVFLQGIQYMVMASTIAPKYPKTLFVCVDCFAANYSNVYRIWLDTKDAGFILGAMAGKLTHSNSLGMIGGGRVPSIWAGHEGFKLGAFLANPSVKFNEKYEAFSWADAAGAQKDATQLIQNGADVVYSSGDGIDVGVIAAATQAASSGTKVWATNAYSNLTAVQPSANSVLLGSMVVNWSVLFNAAIVAYVNGNSAWGFLTANMASGVIQVQPGPNVPANIKALAARLQSQIVQGTLTMYFSTNASSGNPVCFDSPTAAQCADTSASTMAAQLNFVPSLA